MQNPIGKADSHGFCISNCEGTEQLRSRIIKKHLISADPDLSHPSSREAAGNPG